MIEKSEIPKNGESSVLEGIVIPRTWDENGFPTEFSLFTFDEKEYKIDPHQGKGPDVSTFIRRTIKVTFRPDKGKQSNDYIIPDEIFEMNLKE